MRASNLVWIAASALALAGCKSEPKEEFINLAFTISVDTKEYRQWDFDLDACEDFSVDWIDAEVVRQTWMETVTEYLDERGFERSADGETDFLISYEFWVEDAPTEGADGAAARGSIVIRDAASGRFLWRATRRAHLHPDQPRVDTETGVRTFTEAMLDHIGKLRRQIGQA